MGQVLRYFNDGRMCMLNVRLGNGEKVHFWCTKEGMELRRLGMVFPKELLWKVSGGATDATAALLQRIHRVFDPSGGVDGLPDSQPHPLATFDQVGQGRHRLGRYGAGRTPPYPGRS